MVLDVGALMPLIIIKFEREFYLKKITSQKNMCDDTHEFITHVWKKPKNES